MNPEQFVVALANRKGGSGKTTTAVNLAAQWGQQGLRTLLIDLDTQGHAAIGLGCREARLRQPSIHQIFHDVDVDLMEIVQPTEIENIWLAPADTNFEHQALNILCLRDAINDIVCQQQFQRIVIDTPPTFDSLLVSGLVAAHGVIIPFLPHHLAEVGTRQLAKLCYQVASQHNSALKLVGLLPVMFDRHIESHQHVVARLKTQFGKDRMLRAIRNNIKIAEAFDHGMPVGKYAPKSAGSMDFFLAAQEIDDLIKYI